jgi:hypothetical protein
MECYEGATMIKTFRGLMAHNTTDEILLHTNTGSTGYRITKLQAIPNDPAGTSSELTIKIFTVEARAATPSATIDFSDQTLLACVYFPSSNNFNYDGKTSIIFDTMVFNQDIYVTCFDSGGSSASANYYIELEQVKLDLNENTVATLKDIRNIKRTATG